MNIFYNLKTQKWVTNEQTHLTFGGVKHDIMFESIIASDHIPFQLRLKDQHLGPLIGIMTSSKNKNSLTGNRDLFINIQLESLKRNALSYVFSIDAFDEEGSIFGYIYLPDKKIWLKAKMPAPDVVYNRIPSRISEKSLLYQQNAKWFEENNIPLFNPSFIDKWLLFNTLKTRSFLSKNLPETIMLNSKEALWSFLLKHKSLYLKSRLSARGKNTYRLTLDQNFLILQTQNETDKFISIDELLDKYPIFFDSSYIAQCAITPMITDSRRFDFRILSHWSKREQNYLLTGVGIRAAKEGQLTTHLELGGMILPYSSIKTPEHDNFIIQTVHEVGYALMDKIGFFGEFSIDAGLDSEGNYVLYEVNSKPMSFDEKNIEHSRINNLSDLFFQLTNFD